jgi:Protein of unknown function (DUF2948)
MKREILAAEDAEDLQIISAKLQDAVARVGDLAWLPHSRRFAALFNRFKWENKRRSGNLRVRSGLYFNGVLSVRSHKIMRGDLDAVLSLLAITFTAKGAEDPGGTVEMIFAGGGTIKLDVEALDAGLSDVSGEWAALGRPEHETDS